MGYCCCDYGIGHMVVCVAGAPMSAVRFCDGYSGDHFEHNAIKAGRCYVLAAEYEALELWNLR